MKIKKQKYKNVLSAFLKTFLKMIFPLLLLYSNIAIAIDFNKQTTNQKTTNTTFAIKDCSTYQTDYPNCNTSLEAHFEQISGHENYEHNSETDHFLIFLDSESEDVPQITPDFGFGTP